MAYAEKYNLTFVDLKSVTWRIGILKNGYVGSSSGITGQGDPININWHGNGLFGRINASEATLNLQSTTNFQYSEFFTASETDYILEVKKNGVMFWNGIYIPENYNEPYIDFPYPITLRFQDGLAYLKKIKLNIDIVYSVQQIGFILTTCFNSLPSDISKNIREIINVFEQSAVNPSTNGYLWTTNINARHFGIYNQETKIMEGMSMYDVIDMLMHDNGFKVYQWNNKWYVFRVEEAKNTTVNYFTYASGGGATALNLQKTITNKDTGNPNELIWIYRSAELTITEKFNEIIANYQYKIGNKDSTNILPAMNITSTDNATRNHSASWTESSALQAKTTDWYYYDLNTLYPIIYNNAFLTGNKLSFDVARLNGLYVGQNVLSALFDSTLSITAIESPLATVAYRSFPHPTTDYLLIMLSCKFEIQIDTLNFNIDVNNEIAPYAALLYFKLKIGSYYLNNKAGGGYEWTTTDSTARMEIHADSYNISQETVEKMNVKFWMGQFGTNLLTIKLPEFAASGSDDLTFILYAPVLPKIPSGSNDKINVRRNFQIEYPMLIYKALNIETGDLKTTKNLISTAFKNILNVDLATGDGPYAAATGSYLLPTGVSTANWYYDEDIYTINSHVETFILKPYSRFYNSYRKKLNGTLYGDINFYDTLIDNGVIYIINSMNYNIKKCEYGVELEEISGVVSGTITEIAHVGQLPATEFTNTKTPTHSYNDNPTTIDVSTLTNQTGIISEVAKVPRINDKVTLDKDTNDYPL